MAKRKPYRKYLRGAVDELITLGTLGAKVAIATAFDQTVNERTFVSSVVATWSLSGFTKVDADGPIVVGLSHGDYSAAEIEAWIENTGAWNEGDKVAQEIAKRKIRMVGTFRIPQTPEGSMVLNDGKMIKTKLNFILNQGITLNLWAYNIGTGALTIGGLVHLSGHANLWPQ